VVSSRENCDIKEQETGVDLALKLRQIVRITTTPGGRLAPRTALFYGFESAATNDICSTLWRRFHQHGPRYQLTNSSHPARGESFVSLLCSTLAIPHHCFFLSPKLEANEPRITPPFFQA
jgi:hypothetical protein